MKEITPTTIETVLGEYEYARNTPEIQNAFDFIQEYLSGENLEHSVEVTEILLRLNLCKLTVNVGQLHRLYSIKPDLKEIIQEKFGDEVVGMLDNFLDFKKLSYSKIEEGDAENFRRLLLAVSKDLRILFVKLADHYIHLRELSKRNLPVPPYLIRETFEIYAPIANRMGLTWLKSELEDIAFALEQPDVYQDIVHKLNERFSIENTHVDRIVNQIKAALDKNNIEAEVSWRKKHIYSIYNKMVKRNLNFEEIYDIVGIRVVAITEGACYVALGLIHRLWTPIPGKFKDYIALPKANGYQSLHTTAMHYDGTQLEFQIRTERMNNIAEDGVASHWSYKENSKDSNRMRRKTLNDHFQWLKQLLEGVQDNSDPTEFINTFKQQIFPDDIYTLTPQGKVLRLIRGATPIDFAFAVHTDIGLRYLYAKVNNGMVADDYPLKNGDVVEIHTSGDSRIDDELLFYAKTNKAKVNIKQYLKQHNLFK